MTLDTRRISPMLAHKPTLSEVLPRLDVLYERRVPDRIFAVMETPSRALAEFRQQYPEGYCAQPDPAERIAFWDRLLAERADVEDDSVPAAYLSEMDQGLYGGLVGGTVQFMAHPETGWISSMVAPILRDWSELETKIGSAVKELKAQVQAKSAVAPSSETDSRAGNTWFRRYEDQLRVFVEGATGKFGVSHFILINGLNFLFELLGATQTYLSLYEHPDEVRRAIELAYEINVAVQSAFFDQVEGPGGGTCSNMVQWIPGRIVSESVDPFHMTSVECLEQWGREPVERIFRRFDGGVLHIHGNGRHLLAEVARFEGLKAVYLGDDRGFPRTIDVLEDLQCQTGDLPLLVDVEFDTFVDRLDRHELPGGVLYRVAGVPGSATANRLMERVRAYRQGVDGPAGPVGNPVPPRPGGGQPGQ